MKRIQFIFLGLVVLLISSACKPKFAQDVSTQADVVVTTTMALDMVSRIAGEDVSVVGLMGPGVDPHSYRSKASDTTLLNQAKVIFYNGLHLEGRMQKTLEAMKKSGRKVYALTDALEKSELIAPQEDFPGNHDPHVWGDPALWIKCIDEAEKGLSEVFPDKAEVFQSRAEALRSSYKDLHEWAKTKIETIPASGRILVTSHDAFFYFGKAFDFQVSALQGLSTVSEAGLKDRKDLVEFIQKNQLKTIFPETSVNEKGIAEIARESGVKISEAKLFSDAMGAPGEMETKHEEIYDLGTYEGMLKHNINAVVDGLK